MQYKFALENDILDDPRTASAFNEFAPMTNTVIGTGSLKSYADLRLIFPKIVTDTNNIESLNLKCDCCLSSVSYVQNRLIYCELCLAAVHVNCHGRKLMYAYQGSSSEC